MQFMYVERTEGLSKRMWRALAAYNRATANWLELSEVRGSRGAVDWLRELEKRHRGIAEGTVSIKPVKQKTDW